MTAEQLRQHALELRARLEEITEGIPWPPHLQKVIYRCPEDLEVAIAASEAGELLEGVEIANFEALRGLLRKQ